MINKKRFISGLLALAVATTSIIDITTTATTTTTTTETIEAGTVAGISYKYFKYSKHEDYIEITGYTNYNTPSSMVIPDTIDDLPVKKIGDNAFSRLTMQSVYIPEGVTEIGGNAFFNCNKLTDVTMPESVEIIGIGAFANCSMLEYITIPAKVTEIGGNAFGGCSMLKNITIPESVESIGSWAFIGCNNCEYVKILNSNCEIYDDKDTFQQNIIIYGCEGSTAKAYAASYNRSFLAIDSEGNIITTTTTTVTTEKGTIPGITYKYFEYVKHEDSVEITGYADYSTPSSMVIPDTIDGLPVKKISDDAFSRSLNMQSVYIPEGVTEIGGNAFFNCNKLTDITIPESVEIIGSGAFAHCTALTSITIPEKVTEIGGGAFEGCSMLKNITIPESVKSIGSWAFIGCNNCEYVKILNPNCEIYDDEDTFQQYIIIYGYEGSTAETYASAYNRSFVAIESQSPDTTTTTTTATTVAATATSTTASPTTTTTTTEVFGDINGDGIVDAVDATSILAYYAYTSTGGTADLKEFLNS